MQEFVFCFVPKIVFYKVGCCRKRNIENQPNCSECQLNAGVVTNNSAKKQLNYWKDLSVMKLELKQKHTKLLPFHIL